MSLINRQILVDGIKENKLLAGAFNTTNYETTLGILSAVERSGLTQVYSDCTPAWL